MNNQKKLIVMVIALSLILILSSSYALLRSTKESQNNYVINIGDVKVTFQDLTSSSLELNKMYPMTDEEGISQEKELVFTVKNEGSVKSYFNVSIEETSTNPEFKSVIKYIVKKGDGDYNKPVILSENKYIDYNASLEPTKEATYHVKVYLDESADNTYMGKTFNAKIRIESSQETYVKTGVATEVIKEKLGKDGIVGVTLNSEPTTDKTASNIREYRYSGFEVNNYVYFNCKDDVNHNMEQDGDNCEKWRILGVFKDENNEEHLKLVRNEVLPASEMPDTYEVKGKNYKIRVNNSSYAYFDYDGEQNNSDNNWADAGIMYWLNSKGEENGYLKNLTTNAQNMIVETTYYLGNAFWNDTAVQSYEDERKSTKCDSSITSNSHDNNCSIWANNEATWLGKIALMYPSDYGYSLDSSYWSNIMLCDGLYQQTAIFNTSWLFKNANHMNNNYEWLLSPTSGNTINITNWLINGNTNTGWAYSSEVIRPVLYLKSEVSIIDGIGSSSNPYKLELK